MIHVLYTGKESLNTSFRTALYLELLLYADYNEKHPH